MAVGALGAIAESIVADCKGILAADESTGTITKRFDAISVESNEENRRTYRNLLFTAPGLEQFIGGVILFDETIRQSADDGTPVPLLLASKGVVPGIKVDTGAHPLAGAPGETVTEGLDGLRGRLEEYYVLGARFAKWRAPLAVGEGLPSDYCIATLAHALAPVLQRRVRDFVPHHGGQPGVILRDRQDAGIDADFSAGQAEGVRLLALEDHELPLRAGQVHD